ncbi:MAG: hypothetical protein HND58_09650 [Planctomycetota bacterium]|nr:MAG: hypothetical protein HND58_09650 [Planctomycetota bacterium]
MRLWTRVRKLERKRDARPCRYCSGFGCTALVDEQKGERMDDARGCKMCGRVSKLIVLRADRG